MSTVRANKLETLAGNTFNVPLQVKSLVYTDVFTSTGSQTLRIPITNFFVDITPRFANSQIVIIANLAVGFSNTPEWSWFVDRTVGELTTQVGTSAYIENRMNGYHGGPRDENSANQSNEVHSFSHAVVDSPNTTSTVRYQVCFQDRWQNFTAKYINRSGTDLNQGYITRGSSSLIVMEIAQ